MDAVHGGGPDTVAVVTVVEVEVEAVLVVVVVVVGTLAAESVVLELVDVVPAPPPALPQAARSKASGSSSAFLMLRCSSIA
jgi:hypothetical protein